jgi:hypothetical protein
VPAHVDRYGFMSGLRQRGGSLGPGSAGLAAAMRQQNRRAATDDIGHDRLPIRAGKKLPSLHRHSFVGTELSRMIFSVSSRISAFAFRERR